MTWSARYVTPSGMVARTVDEQQLRVPVFAGVLKHPTLPQLRELLSDPVVVRKYTREALRRLPWIALRRFPRSWLAACLPSADLSEGRRRALEFMLDLRGPEDDNS